MTAAGTVQQNPIGCIVLAAGSSSRFGSDKRRYQLTPGVALLAQTLALLQPLFTERVLVLKPDDTTLAEQYRNDWRIVTAADANLGMGHSLAAAMPAAKTWQAAVIALADMPWVLPGSIVAVRNALTPSALVVPHFQERRGNPVGIGRDYFPRLAALQGDSGARQLLQKFSDRIVRLDLDDPGLVRDLDTPP
ncbi:MAG TPA: nucleotidyltransferase family protein [Candidatus Acidoferrum sp.]|nr:nucleotidyltransferase family protein [Candidatus Acidoferrum sp.]